MPDTPMPGSLAAETARRRTFAIISHPDAGKTTLTEKLLLYSGAIRTAGSVKARKSDKHATSDWMDIEKQRGISVTSSAMQFEFDGYHINILDTPGHQDFSEDTYRVLVAADSAVMLIDAAKGVEAQTIKLFKVCRLRNIPIFTFVNKMDRAGKDPFALMEEMEQVLGIRACPINWPIGTDGDFKGVYHRDTQMVELYESGDHGKTRVEKQDVPLNDPQLPELLGERLYKRLTDEIELLDIAGDSFDLDLVRKGELTPMFFGSAITNFGVEPFLKKFLQMTPPPTARTADIGVISPFDPHFSAFVFKIQANMNKAHRDRIAFMRICSGKFERNEEYFHVQGNKPIKLAQPQQMMAEERQIIDEAYAGDIIGVFDPGIYSIGDTICSKDKKVRFEGIPTFAPEHFAAFERKDTMKRKQFETGIRQIAQEGAIQIFKIPDSGFEDVVVGVVGTLQFDVLEYRLQSEYSTAVRRRALPYENIRWIVGDTDPATLTLTRDTKWVQDFKGNNLLLFGGEWNIAYTLKQNPGLELAEFSKN